MVDEICTQQQTNRNSHLLTLTKLEAATMTAMRIFFSLFEEAHVQSEEL